MHAVLCLTLHFALFVFLHQTKRLSEQALKSFIVRERLNFILLNYTSYFLHFKIMCVCVHVCMTHTHRNTHTHVKIRGQLWASGISSRSVDWTQLVRFDNRHLYQLSLLCLHKTSLRFIFAAGVVAHVFRPSTGTERQVDLCKFKSSLV